jgi:hypothetical protein
MSKLPYNVQTGTTFSVNPYAANGLNLTGSTDTIYLGEEKVQPYINISLIKAHGGTIVQCKNEGQSTWEYYVVPENCKNFDKELGKIISIQLLKSPQ